MIQIEQVEISKNSAEEIAKVEKECFVHPWSAGQVLSTCNGVFFLAKDAEKTIGYAGMYYVLDEAYVTNIGVLPAYRKNGIGKQLLQKLLQYSAEHQMRFLSLEVRKSNFAAINLYEQFGFTVAGERKNYYTDPLENALIMTKNIG